MEVGSGDLADDQDSGLKQRTINELTFSRHEYTDSRF